MKAEELVDIVNNIDVILHGYGIVVDHDILAHHVLKVIKESYPNHYIELELPELKVMSGLKSLPEIV